MNTTDGSGFSHYDEQCATFCSDTLFKDNTHRDELLVMIKETFNSLALYPVIYSKEHREQDASNLGWLKKIAADASARGVIQERVCQLRFLKCLHFAILNDNLVLTETERSGKSENIIEVVEEMIKVLDIHLGNMRDIQTNEHSNCMSLDRTMFWNKLAYRWGTVRRVVVSDCFNDRIQEFENLYGEEIRTYYRWCS